ncbi:hypothetical protein M5K25_001086 [Dendrobium thyrsiflorum]|uniref:Uncharacterized protein n=1 Tax=Dendrobium thyrsiflorum TaxID=117978 RepID=A0ABD0VVK2_DENTH
MGRAYSRIERLDEKNPMSPRLLDSNIIKIFKCSINQEFYPKEPNVQAQAHARKKPRKAGNFYGTNKVNTTSQKVKSSIFNLAPSDRLSFRLLVAYHTGGYDPVVPPVAPPPDRIGATDALIQLSVLLRQSFVLKSLLCSPQVPRKRREETGVRAVHSIINIDKLKEGKDRHGGENRRRQEPGKLCFASGLGEQKMEGEMGGVYLLVRGDRHLEVGTSDLASGAADAHGQRETGASANEDCGSGRSQQINRDGRQGFCSLLFRDQGSCSQGVRFENGSSGAGPIGRTTGSTTSFLTFPGDGREPLHILFHPPGDGREPFSFFTLLVTAENQSADLGQRLKKEEEISSPWKIGVTLSQIPSQDLSLSKLTISSKLSSQEDKSNRTV